MIKISPAVRISFGLVMFTLSVVLVADLFGVVPKKDVILMDARKQSCEALAVQLSFAASRQDFDVVKATLELFVERNHDVIAASMSEADGRVIAKFGEFIEFNGIVEDETSTENMVVVPIFAGTVQWGTVNVEFKTLYSNGMFSYFTDTIMGLLLLLAVSCFIGYQFILRRALTVLDPKKVVPERVRTAFNTLAEGVMILDDKERIIMANDAFAKKVNKDSDELLGENVSNLKWKHINKEQLKSKDGMPWQYAIHEGKKKMGVALNLSTKGVGVRSFSTNCAPIQDDHGKTKGALVTFDDVTEVEETNVVLENAVTTLKQNEIEINRKNDELEILATRDPLTGCYNRRAYFDLSERALEDAEISGAPVSVIMLDIDHFKSVNDRFGHSIGDEAIRLVANVINNYNNQENAIVGRYGGEEFCLTLPGVDVDLAMSIAENLRLVIETNSMGFCAKNVVMTSSFGVTCSSEINHSCSQLLDEADQALYVAKETGRNRVVNWQHRDNVEIVKNGVVTELRADSLQSQEIDSTENIDNMDVLRQRVNELEAEVESFQASKDRYDGNQMDPITKLPSKVILEDRISQSMVHAERSDKLLSVVVLDIDMFNRINATMGEVVGNEFLRAVGHRLKDILRRSDTVASLMSAGQAAPSFSRLKNDEFALLLTGLEDVESLTYVIKRIQEKFSGKLEVAGNELYVTTSIGMAVFPGDGDKPDELIENARRAQKQAKSQTGRNNFQLYSQEYNSKIIDQLQIEIELHNALESNHFELLYQPKMDMKTGKVNSLEALIRWNHPANGTIFPDSFIPVAEKTGMIVDMGRWCLFTACAQAKLWVDMGAHDIRIAVNISAIEFSSESFKDTVVQALKAAGISSNHLEIELTETTLMEDPEVAQQLIEELRYLGVTVTLDDFGTGYSSLSYFGKLEMDWLKLDRSFLLEAMENQRSKTMYSSVIRMAHDTGVQVVSEGVETQEQFDYVRGLEVDTLQGYILSKPINVAAMSQLLFPEHYAATAENKNLSIN